MVRKDHLPINPYDFESPQKYEAVKRFLMDLIHFPCEVEHVGSTSVEGLGGKRIIDILIICSKENMRNVVSLLESSGYKFNPEEGFGTFPERYFISGWFPYKNDEFHVHYHITFSGSYEHKDKLLFRNYLRKNYEIATEYYEKKKRGCIIDGNDIRFAWDKTKYIKNILVKAEKEMNS